MAWRGLTKTQWEAIRGQLPPPKTSPQGGRPRVEDRRCFEGILWILWTGAQWSELPRRYGSPSTCWRRLKSWEETGILLKLWRAFLAQLNDRQQLRWDECFVDGRFIPAKGGPQSRPDQAGQGHKVDGSGRWRGYSVGSIPGRGLPGGGHPHREDARHDRRQAAGHARTAPQAARPLDGGSGR
jgi:transposase